MIQKHRIRQYCLFTSSTRNKDTDMSSLVQNMKTRMALDETGTDDFLSNHKLMYSFAPAKHLQSWKNRHSGFAQFNVSICLDRRNESQQDRWKFVIKGVQFDQPDSVILQQETTQSIMYHQNDTVNFVLLYPSYVAIVNHILDRFQEREDSHSGNSDKSNGSNESMSSDTADTADEMDTSTSTPVLDIIPQDSKRYECPCTESSSCKNDFIVLECGCVRRGDCFDTRSKLAWSWNYGHHNAENAEMLLICSNMWIQNSTNDG